MKRILLAALMALSPVVAHAQTDMQALVDRSTLALQDAVMLRASSQPRMSLTHARAVLICPQIFKAGFFFGGSGGQCVLVARAANGTWSYPAFYAIGSASFGFQIGVQDSEVVMMIMTNRGLNAILNSNFKIGAGGSLAIAMFGGGVQGDTTAAVGADIVAFMISRGAFAGVSLEGSILDQLTGWDQKYYNQSLDARQIVIQMMGQNPGADPLREMLTRFGTPQPPAVVSYGTPGYGPPQGYAQQAPPYSQPPGYAPANPPAYPPAYPPGSQGYAQAPVNLQPNAPIQQQNLPPPR